MTTKTICALIALLILPAALPAQTIKVEGKTMGPIEYTVIIDPLPEGVGQQEAAEKIQAALDRVNDSMSTYISESEISRFNSSRSTAWFKLSAETAKVVQRSLEISVETEGAFDITVGPLVDLWKFGKDKADFEIPTDSEISTAKTLVGYKKLEIRTQPPAIKKTVPGIRVDLSAIAKGYAVDQVAETLIELGATSFMVEVGGEVRTAGKKSEGGQWQIGIELPQRRSRGHEQFVKLSDAAMATSGDYRNFHVVDGKTYSHTIDPATGMPVTHQLASLSVVAPDCMTADAYATAALVLGSEKGKQVLNRLGLEYHAIERVGDGFESSSSDGFEVITPPKTSVVTKKDSVIPMFVGAVVVFGLAILGMAVGAMLNNKPITGSCGGLSAQSGDTSCSLCHKPTTDCPDIADDPVSS